MEKLLSIGELSSSVGISIRTIRYYEEVGILSPFKTSESNYRYYGQKEAEKLEIIIFLKKLGFTLQEIRFILTGDKRIPLIEMLLNHQSQLDSELNKLILKKETLHSVVSLITKNEEAQINPLDIIKEIYLSRKEQMNMICNNNLPIKVIGIGNGSVSVVNALIDSGAKMDFIHVDCDKETLSKSKAYSKILVGGRYTNGFGTSGDFQTGEKLIHEDIEQVKEAIKGSDVLFILAYMGGGMGSSAAALIAQEARMLGAITIGILVNPSIFSSKTAISNAEKGIKNLKKHVDTILEIPTEVVYRFYSDIQSANQAYVKLDGLIQNVIHGLTSIITSNICSVEFDDFKFLMREQGYAYIGIGKATGVNKAVEAVEQALSSPTMREDINGAESIIVSITGASNLTLREVEMINETIKSKMKSEANMISGAVIEKELRDCIMVIVVACGYK